MSAPVVGGARIEITGDLDQFGRQASAGVRRSMGQVQTDVRSGLRRVETDTAAAGTRSGTGMMSGLRSRVSVGMGGIRTTVSEQMHGIGGMIAGAFAVAKVKDFFGSAMDEAREAQKVNAQTGAVIKSTGDAAGLSATQFGDLATTISNYAGIDDEVIQSGENLLATFTKVHDEAGRGNDIFTHATKVATDLSVATGTSMTGAARLLGKALNDPTKGMSALTRVGVTFTTQQQANIKSLIAHGKALDAQKLILAGLDKKFGGSAAAQATSADKAGVAWKNLEEQVGTALIPILDKLESIITKYIIPAFRSVFSWMESHKGIVEALGVAVAALFTAFLAYKIINSVREAMVALNLAMDANPIMLIVAAAAALAVGLVYLWNKSETFRDIVKGVFNAVSAAAMWLWHNVLEPIFDAIKLQWSILWAVFQTEWKIGKAVFDAIVSAAEAVGHFFTDTLPGFFSTGWHKVTGFFTAAWDWISNVFSTIWHGVTDVVMAPIHAAQSAASTVWNAIRGVFTAAWDWVSHTFATIWGGITNVIMAPIRAVTGFIGKVWTDVKDAAHTFIGEFGKIWDGLENFFKVPIQFLIETVLNHGLIAGWNMLTGWIPWAGSHLHIPDIPVPWKGAEGGVLPGYAPGRDSIHALLAPGEGVVRPEVTRWLGAQRIVAWNALGKAGKLPQRFASGGVAGLTPTNPGGWIPALTDAASGWAHDLGDLYHGPLGQITLGMPAGVVTTMAKWIGAQVGRLAKYIWNATKGTYEHQVGGKAAAGLGALWDAISHSSTSGQGSVARPASSGSPIEQLQAYAFMVLTALGLGTRSQLGALVNLWNGESGWRWNATNWSSGAYGIPQALPASKMSAAGSDWRTDPATQIEWGLGYIASRYGSPSNAYSQWLGRNPHWYDSGGLLPPGLSMVYNGTRRPELVAPERTFRDLLDTQANNNPAGDAKLARLTEQTNDLLDLLAREVRRNTAATQRVGGDVEDALQSVAGGAHNRAASVPGGW